jgi:hypothetical protein
LKPAQENSLGDPISKIPNISWALLTRQRSATQEAVIKRITVKGQPRQVDGETLSGKKKTHY